MSSNAFTIISRQEHQSVLSESLQHQLTNFCNLPKLFEMITLQLRTIPKGTDIELLLMSLQTALERIEKCKKTHTDMIDSFGHLFQAVLAGEAGTNQVAEWYEGCREKRLRHVLTQTRDVVTDMREKEIQRDVTARRASEFDFIINQMDEEIQILEHFVSGNRHILDSSKDKIQHLCKIAAFLSENTLTQAESQILQEVAAKSEYLMSCNQIQQCQIEQFYESIQHLSHRYTQTPNMLLKSITTLLKAQLHFAQLAMKGKENNSQNQEEGLDSIQTQLNQKLLLMRDQTANLVRRIARQVEDSGEPGKTQLEVDYEKNLKLLKEYENQIDTLNHKVLQHSLTIESVVRVKDQFAKREENLTNQIKMLEAENSNLRKIMSSQSPEGALKQEVDRLQQELKSLHNHMNIISKTELRDQAEIERLSMLVASHEREETSSRLQLEDILKNYKEHQSSQIIAQGNNIPNEEKYALRIKQLQQEIQLCTKVNEVYVQNQRNLEQRLLELQKQNGKLSKKKVKLECQIRELSERASSSHSQNILSDDQMKQRDLGFEASELKIREKAMTDKIVVLTLTLETIKAKYLEEVRKRAAVSQKIEQMNRQHGTNTEDRVQLFVEKKTLEDQNRMLSQTLDKINQTVSDLQKRNRKLLKDCASKQRLIEQLQFQMKQLCAGTGSGLNTQRTTEFVRRRATSRHIKTKQQLTMQNDELREKIRHIDQERNFYSKAIKDQIFKRQDNQLEAKLEQANSKILYLETNLQPIEKKNQMTKSAVSSGGPSENYDHSAMVTEAKIQQLTNQRDALVEQVKAITMQLQCLRQNFNTLEEQNNFMATQNQFLMNEIKMQQQPSNSFTDSVPNQRQKFIPKTSEILSLPLILQPSTKLNNSDKPNINLDDLNLSEPATNNTYLILSYLMQQISKIAKVTSTFSAQDKKEVEFAIQQFSSSNSSTSLSELMVRFTTVIKSIFFNLQKSLSNKVQSHNKLRESLIHAIGWGKIKGLFSEYLTSQKPDLLFEIESILKI